MATRPLKYLLYKRYNKKANFFYAFAFFLPLPLPLTYKVKEKYNIGRKYRFGVKWTEHKRLYHKLLILFVTS